MPGVLIKNKTTLSTAFVLALAISGFASDAVHAATSPSEHEIVGEFIEALGVSPDVSQQLEEKYFSLPPTEQAAVAVQIAEDPASSLVFQDNARSVTALRIAEASSPRSGTSSVRAAAPTSYKAADTVTGYFLGIAVGSFTTEFKYNLSAAKVTSVLECKGRFTGLGLAGDASPSSYISSGGRGTCEVTFKMSLVIKGGPVQFNKLHNITTNSGSPKAYTATLKNG